MTAIELREAVALCADGRRRWFCSWDCLERYDDRPTAA
jgi:hypothetical protein